MRHNDQCCRSYDWRKIITAHLKIKIKKKKKTPQWIPWKCFVLGVVLCKSLCMLKKGWVMRAVLADPRPATKVLAWLCLEVLISASDICLSCEVDKSQTLLALKKWHSCWSKRLALKLLGRKARVNSASKWLTSFFHGISCLFYLLRPCLALLTEPGELLATEVKLMPQDGWWKAAHDLLPFLFSRLHLEDDVVPGKTLTN